MKKWLWNFQSGRLVRLLALGGMVTAGVAGAFLLTASPRTAAKDDPVPQVARRDEARKAPQPPAKPLGTVAPEADSSAPAGLKPFTFPFRGSPRPLFCEDVADPYHGLTRFHPGLPHVSSRPTFDDATRTLRFSVNFQAPESELIPVRKRLAREYALNGGLNNVTWQDIHLAPLPLLGYRIDLRAGGRVIPLHQREPVSGTTFLPGEVRLAYQVPEGDQMLIELLRDHPEYSNISVEAWVDFQTILHSQARVKLVQSAVQKVVEQMASDRQEGTTRPRADVMIVDRHGLQEVRSALLKGLSMITVGEPEASARLMKRLAERIDREIQNFAPRVTLRELLAEPKEGLFFYPARQGQADVKGRTWANIVRAWEKHHERTEAFESLVLWLSDQSRADSSDERFHHALRKRLQSDAGGSASAFFGAVSGKFNFHLDLAWSELDDKRRAEVHQSRLAVRDERQLKKFLAEKTDEKIAGHLRETGVDPAALDLHRVAASTFAARLLFSAHDVKLLDRRRVAFVSEFALELRKPEPKAEEDLDKHILGELATHQKSLDDLNKELAALKKSVHAKRLAEVTKSEKLFSVPTKQQTTIEGMTCAFRLERRCKVLIVAKIGGVEPETENGFLGVGVRFNLVLNKDEVLDSTYLDYERHTRTDGRQVYTNHKDATLICLRDLEPGEYKLRVTGEASNSAVLVSKGTSHRTLIAVELP